MANETIIGFDYKDFLRDSKAWPQGVHLDDVVLIVNGKRYGDDDDLMVEEIPNTASIEIETGDVMRGQERLSSLQEHYDRWKQDHDNDTFVVVTPKRLTRSIIAAIEAAGGSVTLVGAAAADVIPPSRVETVEVRVVDGPRVATHGRDKQGLFIKLLAIGRCLNHLDAAAFCNKMAVEHGYDPHGQGVFGPPQAHGVNSWEHVVWYYDKQK